jgi:hypothetical protein
MFAFIAFIYKRFSGSSHCNNVLDPFSIEVGNEGVEMELLSHILGLKRCI